MPPSIERINSLLNEFLKKFSYCQVEMYRMGDVSTTVRLDGKEHKQEIRIVLGCTYSFRLQICSTHSFHPYSVPQGVHQLSFD